ncbi:baseplate assembly protein [Leptospira kmetyi]|uniref:Baseplate assembly protein n=1 Tax=Leptospira kmetyi TaxID=408139 RepID=A0ABX4N6R9_9LEPT|nr:baseplate assembly protein [Leptospira kmetyi]PJZ29083.1 baseplate assembly protein [Leptospira kmetyi]PJZ39750.1 baseplate assembly protein [Leptospira kmetyi]
MRGSFSNDSFEWEERPQSPDSRNTPPIFARVLEVLPRFRADVITTQGEIFKKVRVFGPVLFSSGNAHGRAFGLKKDVLVLLEFIGGSYRSPVITQVFSFPTKDPDLSNLSSFWEKCSDFNFETDIIDFHESGYAIRQTTNKLEVYDQAMKIVFELDFQNGKGKFFLQKLEIESEVEIKGNTKITGNLEIEGDTNQTGKIKATGKIESGEGLVSSGSKFNDHGHTYNPGPGSPTKSGPPI